MSKQDRLEEVRERIAQRLGEGVTREQLIAEILDARSIGVMKDANALGIWQPRDGRAWAAGTALHLVDFARRHAHLSRAETRRLIDEALDAAWPAPSPLQAYAEGRMPKEQAIQELGIRDYAQLLLALGDYGLSVPRLPPATEAAMTDDFVRILAKSGTPVQIRGDELPEGWLALATAESQLQEALANLRNALMQWDARQSKEMAELVETARRVLGDTAAAWWCTPSYGLGGLVPRQRATMSIEGLAEVRDYVGRLEHGIYT